MTNKERYDKRKSEHRCCRCGTKLPEKYTKVYCAKCTDYNSIKWFKTMERRKEDKLRARPRSVQNGALTISQVVRLAAERHISYGEMVLILEKEGNRA